MKDNTKVLWSDEEVASITAYVDAIKTRMGMPLWNVEVSNEEPEEAESCFAIINVVPDSMDATVYFTKAFAKATNKNKRETVVHELTHCHTDPVQTQALEIVGGHLNKEASEVFETVRASADERLTDWIAKVLSPHFPEPEWGKNSVLPVAIVVDNHLDRVPSHS